MRTSIHYVVDNKGIKTSVIVPFDKWEKLNSDYHKLQNKVKVFSSIEKGLAEIKEANKNKVEMQTLSDFLNESNS